MTDSLNSKTVASRFAGWQRPLLLLILLGCFALRLQALTLQNIWWDEARNIDVALRPFTQVATAPELDIHPPVYFWLLHFWLRGLGFQTMVEPTILAFGARMLSVVAAMVATALLYPLGRRLGSPLAGLYTVAIAGFVPFWLAESQEARMYTVGFALLTAAAYFLLKITGDWRLESDHPDVDNRVSNFQSSVSTYLAFVLLTAAALLTHYNAVFILVAWYGWWGIVALLQPKRWRAVRTVLLCGVAMSLLVAPVLPIALRQIPKYANPNLGIPTLGDYLWQNWQAYLAGYAFDPALLNGQGATWLWTMLALLLLALLILPLQTRITNHELRITNHELRNTLFLLTWLFGGLTLYYIAVLDRGAFNVRYSSFITPALYLLLGVALAGQAKWLRLLTVVGLTGLAVGFGPMVRADLYDDRFGREDVAGVTAWIKTTAGPNDIIFVDQKYPFGFYYQRYMIDANATPSGPEAAPARYLFVDINTLDQRLTEWAGQAEKVFWVQWFESDTDPRHAVRFLLNKYGVAGESKEFRGYSVEQWQLTPPTHFELAPNSTPLSLRFGAAVETVAVSLPTELAGTKVPVVIRWQRIPGGQADRPLKARVALYDAQDNRLAQSDERLLNDRHLMPSQWQGGDQPLNVYLLETAEPLPPGAYQVRLLVYDAETLEPLPFIDGAGNPQGIEPVLISYELTSP
jgi:4-amino-4-deoxy-L-arabinose transferase-like glycosyltransferase